jgi:hypothetical protein
VAASHAAAASWNAASRERDAVTDAGGLGLVHRAGE